MKWHIKQWPGSLCCSRLHSRIKALHALRDAVIGEEEDGEDAEKWILLDPAAEPSRTLESLQHVIAPPRPYAKQRSRKRRGEPSGWAPHRCPRELAAYAGPSLLCWAMLPLHTIAAQKKKNIMRQAEPCGSTETKIPDGSVLFSLCSS